MHMIIRSKQASPPPEDFIKIVADLERNILAMGCELHIDCAEELIREGSQSKNLWGANIYPKKKQIAFVSLINIRPVDGNRSMEIQSPEVRNKVEKIIRDLLPL